MVELKSGETYNGTLKGVDKFMNIQMENCIRTDNVFLTIMIERRNLSWGQISLHSRKCFEILYFRKWGTQKNRRNLISTSLKLEKTKQ